MAEKKKIVVLGGGNGSAVSLVALKQNVDLFDISGIIAMSDSGGSSGRLREEFRGLPTGDIMRATLALSKYDYPTLKQIFYKNRFTDVDSLDGHNLGNLFLTLSEHYAGDFMAALSALGQAVEVVGRVYPTTLETTQLIAELSDGQIIKGEANLDRPKYNRNLKIRKVWLEPSGRIYEDARQAMLHADYILLGPGSFYTSVVAALLADGMSEAIAEAKAKIVYIAGDKLERDGETGPEKLSEFISAIQSYLPRPLDLVLSNNAELNDARKKYYESRGWFVYDRDYDNIQGIRVEKFDFERDDGGLCAIKLGKKLKEVLI
jgi:uncharacterized cofD-like protein